MFYKSHYQSPLGRIEILCDDQAVKGVWFEHQKYYGAQFDLSQIKNEENIVTKKVESWLEQYFLGEQPLIGQLQLEPEVTDYRKKVLAILTQVSYGKTITYQEIANKISLENDGKKGAARSVGGAVGHNPISILIPCHRIIGSDGSLTGYAGGLERKIALLNLEGGKW